MIGIGLGLSVGARAMGGSMPTLTISSLSAVGNVVAMQIVASEVVTGLEVGDLTISAGGSLANFATADNITFTVDWTVAVGENTLDIAAGVCQNGAGNNNAASPTYTVTYLALQPDATSGIDTMIVNYAGLTTTNYGTDARLLVGNDGSGSSRALLKFDLTSIPAGSTILSAILSLYANGDNSGNARTFKVFRQKRAWVEGNVSPGSGATWATYDGTNAWQTAGGFGVNDCEQTEIGSRAYSAAETLNQFKDFTLTASAIQEMISGGGFTNNGFMVKADTETSDQYQHASSDHATAGNRPKIGIVYANP